MQKLLTKIPRLIIIVSLLISSAIQAQVVVGSGSYTPTFPGTDAAGRNGYPSGAPQLSGNAIGKPVPTNDWWSKLVKENHADNLFNYPMTMKTTTARINNYLYTMGSYRRFCSYTGRAYRS